MSISKYKTTSINLAAFLIAKGLLLLGKEPAVSYGQYVFVFTDASTREALVSQFITGRGGLVNVHRFLEAQRQLKALLRVEDDLV